MVPYNTTLSALSNSYEYVFSTVPVSQIQDEFLFGLKRCVLSLFESAQSLIYLVLYIGLISAKLAILVFPHAVKAGQVIYDYHRTKLSASDLLLEATSLFILLFSFIFRARIQRTYKTIINYISAKSKVAAKAAPHVLFFTSALVFAVLGKNFLIPLTSSSVMPVFTLIIPLLTTVRVLSELKNMDLAKRNTTIDNKMLLWVILSIYHGVVTLASLVPFSQRILRFLPYVKELVIVVLIWVQLSSVFSRIVFESVISKILVKLCAMIPGGFTVEQTKEKTSTFFSVLKMMYLVNDTQLAFLQALFQDSVATMIAMVFFFTPTYIATVGVVTIALLLPAFRTAAAVATSSASTSQSAHQLARLARPTPAKPTKNFLGLVGGSSAAEEKEKPLESVDNVFSTHWLRYWVCVSVLWLIRIYGFEPWPSVMIVTTLWLQHSYFQGSSKLTSYLSDTSKAIIERNRRIQEEKALEEAKYAAAGEGGLSLQSPDAKSTSTYSRLSGLFSPFTPKRPSANSLSESEAKDSTKEVDRLVGSEDSKDRLERNDPPSSSGSGSVSQRHQNHGIPQPVITAEKDSKSGPFSSEWDTLSHTTENSSHGGSSAEDKDSDQPRRSGRARTPAKAGAESSAKKSKHKDVTESPARKKSE